MPSDHPLKLQQCGQTHQDSQFTPKNGPRQPPGHPDPRPSKRCAKPHVWVWHTPNQLWDFNTTIHYSALEYEQDAYQSFFLSGCDVVGMVSHLTIRELAGIESGYVWDAFARLHVVV